jgi:hypothetical protein
MTILAYIIIGVVTLIVAACAVTPIVINSMSETKRNEMGVERK